MVDRPVLRLTLTENSLRVVSPLRLSRVGATPWTSDFERSGVDGTGQIVGAGMEVQEVEVRTREERVLLQ